MLVRARTWTHGVMACDSERELLWDTSELLKVVGDCTGEVGIHGKWVDVMFPFVRRCVSIYVGSFDLSVP